MKSNFMISEIKTRNNILFLSLYSVVERLLILIVTYLGDVFIYFLISFNQNAFETQST